MKDLSAETIPELLREYFPNLPWPIIRYFLGFPIEVIREALIKYRFANAWELLEYLKSPEIKTADAELILHKGNEYLAYSQGKLYIPEEIKIPLPYFYRYRRKKVCVICGKPTNFNLDICSEHWTQFEVDSNYFWMEKTKWNTILGAFKVKTEWYKDIRISERTLQYLPYIVSAIQENKVWLIGEEALELAWLIKLICEQGLLYVPLFPTRIIPYLESIKSPSIILGYTEIEQPGMILLRRYFKKLDGVKIFYEKV